MKPDSPAPFIHPEVFLPSLFGFSGSSWQQGESLGLAAPFLLSVGLASWQLPRVTAVVSDPFFMSGTQSKSGNPL